jgi:spore germination protein
VREDIGALQRRAIIVNGYAAPQITAEQLARWADNLTYVSYFSYGYNMNGELAAINDENLIRDAKLSGVAPLMVLTPFDESGAYSYDLVREVFTNPVMRDRLINNIVLTATDKNYYGVVFNFGYIATEDNQQFVITVSKSAARLNRRGKLVIVSIVTGINDEGIDYEALGRAANFIELRTFRWEQNQEPPAAIAPIGGIRETVSRIAALVDPRFILLGLPNYGYDWTLPHIQGRTAAETISNAEAEGRASRTGAEIQYDETVQSPHFNYTDGAGAMHEVWFDDARSIRAKLELVNENNLAGVGIWTIMNPFPVGIEVMNELFTVTKV